MFSVDPPLFVNDLQIVNTNRWSNAYVNLPAVIDPNRLNWTINLGPSTPAWIILNNTLLTLNTTDFRYNISETTIVSLKITNELNSWTKYNLTIETAPYTSPSFGVISNITVVEDTQTEVKLELQSSLDIIAIDWENNTIIWIQVNYQESILILNPSNNNVRIQCAKLLSHDSWRNKVYSNEFTIFINKKVISPPILANTFGPLVIYPGKIKLLAIPDDLFISPQSLPFTYSVQILKWSVNTLLNANVTTSKYDNSSVLYLKSNDSKTCFIALCATDSNRQSAETVVEVDARNWASKDCAEWNSEYQIDWVKCNANYVLESGGVCLWKTIYFSDSLNDLFDIWGIIILIWLTFSLVLIVFIGSRSLYSIEYAHTFIIFVVSSSYQNKDLMRLITWFHIFKFDLGFIDYFNIKEMLFCKLESVKMAELQFYCQSTVLNYFMLLAIILIFIWIVIGFKYVSRKLNCASKWYTFIISKLKTQTIAWIIIHIFWPFLWINLLSDGFNFSSHLNLSLLSFWMFAICVILLMIKLPSVFSIEFVKSIDCHESELFTLLTMLKSICHTLLFTFESHSVQVVVLVIEFAIHALLIKANFKTDKEKSSFEFYLTKISGIKHSYFLVILIVVSMDSILMIQISNSQAVALIQISNSQAVALMLGLFFLIWTAIDLCSTVYVWAKPKLTSI